MPGGKSSPEPCAGAGGWFGEYAGLLWWWGWWAGRIVGRFLHSFYGPTQGWHEDEEDVVTCGRGYETLTAAKEAINRAIGDSPWAYRMLGEEVHRC